MDPATSLMAYALAVCGAVEVEIHAAGIDPAMVGNADDLRWTGDPCRSAPSLQLEVIRTGAVVARPTVRPSLTVYVDGWVAAEATVAGQPVVAVAGIVPLGRNAGIDAPGPWIARVDLDAGQPVGANDVTRRPDATRGDPVQVQILRGNVLLHSDGRLLQDGQIGEPVRVHAEATRTALEGVLTTPDTVEIR